MLSYLSTIFALSSPCRNYDDPIERNRQNQFATQKRSNNTIPQDKAGGNGNVNDVVTVEHLELLNNETSPQTDAIRRALADKIGKYVTTDTTDIPQLPYLLSADINEVDQSSCTEFRSCETVLPENANAVDLRKRSDQYVVSLRNNIPIDWETEGLKGGSKLPLKEAPHNMNDCSDLSVAMRGHPVPQDNNSLVTEPITEECEEPPDCNTDESTSNSSDVPISKPPIRSKRRAPQSSGYSNSSDGAGISCTTGSGDGGGYTDRRGSGGGTGRTGRGGDGTGRRGGGVSGRGDEGGGVSGNGDGNGSRRGRGGQDSGGSGDGKRDKKGGGKKDSSAIGSTSDTRVRQHTGTLDSGLGAEKSTSDINIGTDITNPVQGTAKLKNGSLLVPCEAQQQGPEASTLPMVPPLAIGIPSSQLPSLPNTVSSSSSSPSVFVRPKKVAESYEFPVQESQDHPKGGLLYLDPPLFPAAPYFGPKPVFKPFCAGYGGESRFEDTESLLPYTSPVLQSQHQAAGATSTVSEESSDFLETRTDVGEASNPPRRRFSPRHFFGICETCGELPRASLPPIEEQVCIIAFKKKVASFPGSPPPYTHTHTHTHTHTVLPVHGRAARRRAISQGPIMLYVS